LSVHPAPGEGKDWSYVNYKKDCNGNTYSSLKEKFLADGHVTFRSCSLKPELVDAVSGYVGTIKTSRVGDAWVKEDSVRDLAVDPETVDFLGYLHGRQAFPFQTLNFPQATQQPVHSDVIHFDTLPVRGLMTAAWVALEDIHPDSGPLIYYSGSHKMGLWDIDELGIRLHTLSIKAEANTREIYEKKLQETIDRLGLKPSYGTIKKGETFVWAASLLHGGSKLNNPSLTRKSQVTHYFLTGAKKFWVPWKSITSIDHIRYMCIVPACTPSQHNLVDCGAMQVERFASRRHIQHQDTEIDCAPY
jgi:hypothetical protein